MQRSGVRSSSSSPPKISARRSCKPSLTCPTRGDRPSGRAWMGPAASATTSAMVSAMAWTPYWPSTESMTDPAAVAALQAENARLIKVPESHGIEWRVPAAMVLVARESGSSRMPGSSIASIREQFRTPCYRPISPQDPSLFSVWPADRRRWWSSKINNLRPPYRCQPRPPVRGLTPPKHRLRLLDRIAIEIHNC